MKLRQHNPAGVFRNIPTHLAILLCLAAASAAQPQETNQPITLDALVAQALNDNPEVRFYEAEIAEAKAAMSGAGQWQNPDLSIEGGAKQVRTPGAGTANGTAFAVSVAQTIEFPARIQLRKAIANRQLDLAHLGLGKLRHTLANRLKTSALKWQFARERAVASTQVADRAGALLDVLVQRDPAGVAPLLERRVIEAHVVNLRKQVHVHEFEATRQLHDFNFLLRQPLDQSPRMASFTPKLPAPPAAETLTSIAATNNFELLANAVEIEQQGFRVKLEQHKRLPSVTVTPFYSRESTADREHIVGLGISLPLPLWNRNEPAIDAEKARLAQVQAMMDTARRNLDREIIGRVSSYASHWRQLQEWRADAISEFRQAAELGDRHYRLGAIPVSTYLELQTQYLEATDTLLDLRAGAFEDLMQLELLTGRQLITPAAR